MTRITIRRIQHLLDFTCLVLKNTKQNRMCSNFPLKKYHKMNLEIPAAALASNQASRAGKTPEECKILKAKDYKLPGLTRYREGVMKESFYFVQLVNPTFGFAAHPEEGCDYEKNIMEKTIAALNKMNPKPRFVVICGNFTYSKPDEKNYFVQVETFKASFESLATDIPVICVCGRNDMEITSTPESIEAYRKSFGEDWFSFWVEGVLFIVLNSLYYRELSGLESFRIDQHEWLESILLEAQVNPPQQIVVIQSVPWFCNEGGEAENDNNIDLQTRQQVLPKMKEANVKAIISGNCNTTGKDGDLEVILTSPLRGETDGERPGFRVFKLLPHSLVHKFFKSDNTPEDLNIEFS